MSGGSNSTVEELKKGVVNRLDKCGALGPIRAQIRANVYRALLDPHDASETPPDVKREAPLLLMSIVAEFLKSAELERTSETFLREANYTQVKERQELVATLKCPPQASSNDSVLARVVDSVRAKRGAGELSTQAPPRTAVSGMRGVNSGLVNTGMGIGGLDRARESEKAVSRIGSSEPNSIVVGHGTRAAVAPTAAPPPTALGDATGAGGSEESAQGRYSTKQNCTASTAHR